MNKELSGGDPSKGAPKLEPVSWRREWDGDVSDLGQYVHADDRDELDHYGPWEPLYSETDVRQLEASLEAVTRERDEARAKALEEALGAVPTNWLDELLTGPTSVLQPAAGTWGCPQIEALLRGVRERIAALSPPPPIQKQGDGEPVTG